MKDKDRYSIDSRNRLVINRKGKSITADGRFAIDKSNRLSYWLNEPQNWRRENKLPGKISFRGSWQIDGESDLVLALDQDKDYPVTGALKLKGQILCVDGDELAFEIASLDKRGSSHFQLLKLGGSWQADIANRITFAVKKQLSPDILVFTGAWQVNRNQQLTYTCKKSVSGSKANAESTVTFSGFWQIDCANRLTYILTRAELSRFDFRAQLESPNLYPQKGVIKYRLGAGFRKRLVSPSRIISLYGEWKFSRKLGLSFVMDYGAGRVSAIDFNADVYLNDKDTLAFALSNKRNEPLGVAVTFTHKFLKKNSAELYLKLKKLERESAVETGIRIPF